MYMRLLCIDWIDDGFLPSQIGRLVGYEAIDLDGKVRGQDVYNSIVAQLLEQFQPHPTKQGYITNKRLLEERNGQRERAEERRISGAKGGKANQNKRLEAANSCSSASSSATQQLVAKSSSSSSTSSSSSIDKVYDTLSFAGAPAPDPREGAAQPPALRVPKPKKETKNFAPKIDLSESEHEKLLQEFGEESFRYYLPVCSDWLLARGQRMASPAAFMRNWIRKDIAERKGFYYPRPKENGFQPHCAATTAQKNLEYLKMKGYINGTEDLDEMFIANLNGEKRPVVELTGGRSLVQNPRKN